MTPEQILAGARVFALPLKREFRGVTVREGLLIEGPSGWGEFAPFADHADEHAGRWLAAALEQAYGRWPMLLRTTVPVNAIIPVTDPLTTRDLVEQAIGQGCTTIKTKVGAVDFDDDVQRVAAIRAALDDAGVSGAIRIDTNQRWTLTEALARIGVLDAIAEGLEYVEQPVADRDDLQAIRRQLDVPVAVDEGIRLAADPAAAVADLREVADIAVLKSIPLGGVVPALELAARCRLPVVVSGSLDSSVGLASGLWLAGCLPELEHACGLGTGALLAEDVLTQPPTIIDGRLQVRRERPERFDPAGLVDDDMRERWRARFLRAWKHVGAEHQR